MKKNYPRILYGFLIFVTLLAYPSSDSQPNFPLALLPILSQLLFTRTLDTTFDIPAQLVCSLNPCYDIYLELEETFDQKVQLCIAVEECIVARTMEGTYNLGEGGIYNCC
jgi:hypothetical protein